MGNGLPVYGIELILDLHDCRRPFTEESITEFMVQLCTLIGMKRGPLHFWGYDDEEEKAAAPDHLCGTSAIQFIYTSNITIHTLDKLNRVYLNIFTCGELAIEPSTSFCAQFWEGTVVKLLLEDRL